MAMPAARAIRFTACSLLSLLRGGSLRIYNFNMLFKYFWKKHNKSDCKSCKCTY